MVGITSTAPPPPPPPPPRASAATAATVAPRTQPVPVHGTLSIWSGLYPERPVGAANAQLLGIEGDLPIS